MSFMWTPKTYIFDQARDPFYGIPGHKSNESGAGFPGNCFATRVTMDTSFLAGLHF